MLQVGIIRRTGDTKIMIIKDCLPEDEVRVKSKAIKIATELRISSIRLIPGNLGSQISDSCVTEAYLFLGAMMDGKYSRGFEGLPYKMYDVKRKTYESDHFMLF